MSRLAEPNGAICFAIADLEADSEYEWGVATILVGTEAVSDAEDEEHTAWCRFRTGTSDSGVMAPLHVNVQVTQHEVSPFDQCGNLSRATLSFGGDQLTSPVVANLAGVTPGHFAQHAVAIAPGN